MMTYEEEKRCPLCAEQMDWTDQQLKPCNCGYQVCVWCWHQIMDMAEKNETEGQCPACRAPYDKDKIVGMEANFERVVANNANRKNKPPKAKSKTNEEKKDLSNVRVIQRKMAYVIGLPLSLADEDLLQSKEFFGQYGKVSKVSLSRTAGGAIQQFVNDSCSVYITFSKEEEAVRCIQSVHGFVLEGRFLKASFGTAKYCHAWLRNTPCNNSACLYLHSIGAEEDSFSKDEVAAAHTRGRVQQIVGATHNLHRGSGNVLPPPINEHFNYSSAADKPIFRSDLKDVSPDMEASNALPLSKDKDGGVRAPNKMTTFVDIVGRIYSSGPEKDVNGAEDGRVVNLSSELSSVGIHKDNCVEAAHSDAMLRSFSSSSSLANGFPSNKEYKEAFREPSNLWGLGRADVTPSGAFTNEQSGLLLDSEKQILRGPCSAVKDDFLSINDERLKYSESLSQLAPLHPSSCLSKTSEDSSIHAWWHGESRNLNDYNVDETSIACLNSMNDGCNEKKFRSSAKSDKIYKCSNSFSNEEIVEHLRRLDDDNKIHDIQNPSLEAVESSIISNIMSLNFEVDDDSSTSRPNVAGLFDQTDGRNGSSWNLYSNDQSEFSFVKQVCFVNQVTDLDSLSVIGQHFKKCSSLQDLGESTEHYSCKPQYLVSRSQGPAPPGFSLPLREPPPGFLASERSHKVFHANSGTHVVKAASFSKNHYRTPSTGNSSNTSDADVIDPAIMSVGRSKPPNGLTNSCFDMRSTYASQPSAFDDEARLCLLMQQSAPVHEDLKYVQTYMQQAAPTAHQDLKYAQTYMQQALPTAHQEVKNSGQIGDQYSSWDDIYGMSSTYISRQNHSNSPSSYTPFSHQRFANGTLSNGYQPGLDEMQLRNELQSNEKLGFNKFYSGYGDYILQPSSGDLYTRVFGM